MLVPSVRHAGLTSIAVLFLLATLSTQVGGQAVAAQSCWSGDIATCGNIGNQMASSSSLMFKFLLKKADGTLCKSTESCATAAAVTATLDGNAGALNDNTCTTGICIFQWNAGMTKVGNLLLVGTVGGTAVTTTVTFVPADSGIDSTSKSTLSTIMSSPVDSNVSFTLTLRDKFSNTLPSTSLTCNDFLYTISLPSATAIPSCGAGIGSNFTVSWKSTVAGTWTIAVTAKTGSLSLQTTAVLTPLALDPSKSTYDASIPPVSGENGTLAIYVKDKFNNALTAAGATFATSVTGFSALDGGDTSIPGLSLGTPQFASGGRYDLTYSATRSGLYSVTIRESGSILGSGPAQLKIEPTKFWRLAMNISGDGAIKASAGHLASFKVKGVDKFGNRYSQGAVGFTAAITAIRDGILTTSTIVAGQDGSSSCSYTVTASGSYSVSITLIDSGQFDSAGGSTLSTLFVTATAEESRPPSSIYFVNDTTALVGTAGVSMIVQMQEKDEFGNLRTISLEHFAVSLNREGTDMPDSYSVSVADVDSGKYNLNLAPTRSGTYSISIQTGQQELTKGIFSLLVQPAAPHHTKIMLKNFEPDWAQGAVGSVTVQNNRFAISSYDSYENRITIGGYANKFNVTLTSCQYPDDKCHDSFPGRFGSKIISPTVVDLMNGYYGINYSTTVAGYYSAAIKYDGSYILNSPSSLFVEAGRTVANLSYVVDEIDKCSDVLLPEVASGNKTSENFVVTCTEASNVLKGKFGVRLVDTYGNTRYTYSSSDLVKFTTVSVSTLYNDYPVGSVTVATANSSIQLNDGLQEISFFATLSGRYASTIDHYTITGAVQSKTGTIFGSPAAVFVKPASPYAPYSYGEGFGLTLATAGAQNSFFVITRDVFKNQRVGIVSAVGQNNGWTVQFKRTTEMSMSGGYETEGTVAGNSDGKISIRYTGTKAGAYTLFVRLNGNDLSGSPFNVQLSPDISASPSYVTKTDRLFYGRVAVSPIRVNIRSVDQFYNLNTKGQYGGYNSTIAALPLTTIDHDDSNNGSYALIYRVTKTGTYVVDINIRGEAIVGSPVTMIVTSGLAVPNASEIQAVTVATAGITVSFPLIAKDEYYNVRETGPDAFKVQCSNGNDQILDGVSQYVNTGVYSVLCFMTRSGTYQVSVKLVDYRTKIEHHVSGSPFNIQVYATVADPTTSGVFGGGLSLASAGEWSTFRIMAKDRFSNPNTGAGGASFDLIVKPSITALGAPFGAAFLSAIPVCPGPKIMPQWAQITTIPNNVQSGPCANGTSTSVDIGGGTFVISYMWTRSGRYGMELSILSSTGRSFIQGSPFEMNLQPGITDITKSDAWGEAYRTATAGESMTFYVRTKDRFSNNRVSGDQSVISGNASITFTLTGRAPLTTLYNPIAIDLNTGNFNVTYIATASGSYEMNVFNSKGTLQNSPSNVTFYPARSEPTTFLASGNGIYNGSVGDFADIFQVLHVQAKDRFFNIRTKGGDEWRSTLTGGWRLAPDGLTSPANNITTQIQDTGNGWYKMMYTTTKSGLYKFNLMAKHPLTGGFLHILGSPFSVHISSGAVSEISPFISVETGTIIRLTVPGALNTITAGKNNFFVVVAKDKFENPRTEGGGLELFDMKMVWVGRWGQVGKEHGPLNMTLSCPISYVGDTRLPDDDPRIPQFPGQYRVIYPATVSGLYRLVATFNSKAMVGHMLGVQPDVSVPELTSAVFPAVDVNGQNLYRHTTAGVRYSFTILSRDKFDNLRTTGGESVRVNVSGGRNSDAAFAGNVTDAQTATKLRAPVHPQDAALIAAGTDFGIERSRVSCDLACVVDNSDGTYHIYINPTISGQYKVIISINSSLICQTGCRDDIQNPYIFTTVANKLYPPLSVASGEGLSLGTAGQDAEFMVQARDIYGNNRVHGRYLANTLTFSGEFFASNVKVNGALLTQDQCSCTDGVCTYCDAIQCGVPTENKCSKMMQGYPKVKDNQDGTYSVDYQVTHSSNYTLTVVVAGLHIFGSPFRTIVKPYVTDPATCVATGALYTTDAGSSAEVQIQTKDQFGNKRSTGGQNIMVAIIHTDYPKKCQRPFSTSTTCIRCANKELGCTLFNLVDTQPKPLQLEVNQTDFENGRYAVQYMATVSGLYKLHITMRHPEKDEIVDIGSKTIFRSPFPLTCVPDVLDPRSSIVSGEGASLATVDEETQVILWPRDRFGNILVEKSSVALCGVGSDCTPKPGSTFLKLEFKNYDSGKRYMVQDKYSRAVVKLEEGQTIKAVASPKSDGSTLISFVVLDIGRYSVSLEVLDIVSKQSPPPFVHIQGSPFNMSVFPLDEDPFPAMCKVEMAERAKAGSRVSGTVWLKNRFGISLKKGAKNSMLDIVQILGNPSNIDFRIINLRDGSFTAIFSPTRSGSYSLSVRAQDADGLFVDMAGSPTTTLVIPDDVDVKSCLAFVTDIDRLIAGSVLSYMIQSRDKFGNDADATALKKFDSYRSFMVLTNDPSNSILEVKVKEERPTVYSSSFINDQSRWSTGFIWSPGTGESLVTRSGQYKLMTTNLEVDVINSPWVFNVAPGVIAPAVSTMDSSTASVCTAGIFSSVRVQAKDQFGNIRTDRGDEKFVLLRNASNSPNGAFSHTSRYLFEGKTDVFFRAEKTGMYVAHVLESGIEVLGSPFRFEVLPAVANAKSSRNSTVVPSQSVAGVKLSFSIQAVDEFGNLHQTGGAKFDVTLKGLSYLRTFVGTRLCTEVTTDLLSCVTITDNNNGLYLVEFSPTTAGDYEIEGSLMAVDGSKQQIGQPGTSFASPWTQCVRCVNTLFPGRPCQKCRTLSVYPAIVDVSASTTLGRSAEFFSSGEEEEFLIYARDIFGNIQTDGGLDVVATVKQVQAPFGSINTTVQDLCASNADKCGQYSVNYFGTQSGMYTLTISINGNVSKTPRIITGFPAITTDPIETGLPYIDNDGEKCNDVCANLKCCLLGERVSFGNTGLEMTFEVIARDRYGNDMTRGGDSFMLDISGPMLVTGIVEDMKSGKYVARYKTLLPGVYVVSLRLRGIHVGRMVDGCPEISKQCFAGSPAFGLQISNPGTGLEALKFSGNLPPRIVISGQEATFYIDASDETAKKKLESMPLAVSMQQTKRGPMVTPSLTKAGDQYTIAYTVQIAGIWKLSVTAGAQIHCVGSPFRLAVFPGDAVAAQTVVTGAGHVETFLPSIPSDVRIAAVQGKPFNIYVVTRDVYLNERVQETTVDDVRWYILEPGEEADGQDSARRVSEGDYTGQYIITFTPTLSRVNNIKPHQLKVFVGGQAATSNSFPIEVFESAAAVSTMTVAHGAGLQSGIAGAIVTFTIYARDASGCQISVGGASIEVIINGKDKTAIIDQNDGTYLSKYVFNSVGKYDVKILVDSRDILQNSGIFSCTIQAGQPAPLKTELVSTEKWLGMNGKDDAKTYAMSNFLIVLQDEYGNRIPEGIAVDQISVKITGPSYNILNVKDRYCTKMTEESSDACYKKQGDWYDQDGSYLVQYATTAAGRYTVDVSVLGTKVRGSPFIRQVSANVPAMATSYANGVALSNGNAGIEGVIALVLFDEFGNPVEERAVISIDFDITGPIKVPTDRFSKMSGLEHEYEIYYTATVSGQYELTLLIGDSINVFQVRGSPFSVEISPGSTYFSECIASGPGLSLAIAGKSATFAIMARDKYGNYRTTGGDDFKTTLAGKQLASGSLLDYQNGTYLSSYTLTFAGDYTLTSSLGLDQFVYVPSLPCLAADFDGQATELMKKIPSEMEVALCRSKSGEWMSLPLTIGCEFQFQARDRYASEIRSCGDVPVVYVESESTVSGETIAFNGSFVDIDTGEIRCQDGVFTGSLSRYFGYPDPNSCFLEPGQSTRVGPCNGNAGITRAGTYSISISVNGLAIFRSPFRTVVTAGDSFAKSCVSLNAAQMRVGARSAQRDSTAGVPESFTIQSRDVYGNNVLYDPFKPLDVFSAVLQNVGKLCDIYGKPMNDDAVCLVANVKNNLDSTHSVSYVPKVSGKFELNVMLVKNSDQMGISNSPFFTLIKSSVVSVENSVASGKVLSAKDGRVWMNTTVDVFTSFNILARDGFDNIVTNANINFDTFATRRGSLPGDMANYRTDITSLNNNDGTFEVSFTITFAALYSVTIQQGGLQIQSSPFALEIMPGPVFPLECTCEGGGFSGGMTGHPATYNIVARDMFSNQLKKGGARFTVHIFTTKDLALGAEIASIRPLPSNKADGTYSVTYLSPETGKHRIMTWHVEDGVESQIKDFTTDAVFMLDDGYSVPSQSFAFGRGIRGGRAGEEIMFTTQLRNEIGLNRPFGGISLHTGLIYLLSSDLVVNVDTMDVNDGSYRSFYKPIKAGVYLLSVTMSTEHIQGSPFTVTITPSETSAVASSIKVDRSLSSIVAETVTFKIISRDQFYNDQQYDEFLGPDPYQVRLEMPGGIGQFYAGIQNNEDGTYQASYRTTRAGAYWMFVTLKGQPVQIQDDVVVSPGSTVPENCLVEGSGISDMEAGQIGLVQTSSRDFFGNLVQTGRDNFNVTLTKEGGEERWLGLGAHCDNACIAKTSCPCAELKPGIYVVAYQVTAAASYKLSVQLNRNVLPGFPRDVMVSTSIVETTQVSVVGCESVCTCSGASCAPCGCPVMNNNKMLAGLKSTFNLVSRDRFGNKVSTGGKAFRAVMAKAIPVGKTVCQPSDGCTPATVEAEVNDNKDGTYQIIAVGSVPGKYVLNVTRGGVFIMGAPFLLTLAPGTASSAPEGSSFVLDPIATAGSVKTFSILARDMFGNKLSVGGEKFVTQLVGTGASFKNMLVRGFVDDNSDGSYFSYFMVEKAGPFEAAVTLDGMQIRPGRWPITVVPAAVNPGKSSVSGTGLDVLQSAGDVNVDSRFIAPEIRIVPRDVFGNVYSFDGLEIEAISTGPRVVKRSTRQKEYSKFVECGAGCGEYTIYNPLTISGSYSLNVLLYKDGVGLSLLAKGPIVFKLDSSGSVSSKCQFDSAVDSEASKCTTDKVCTFQVQSVDYFGNNVEQRGDTFASKLTYLTSKPVNTVFSGSSSEFRGGDGSIVPGKFVISYSVTASGQYVMQLSRYGLSIANSPSKVDVSPGTPLASACTTNPISNSDGLGMIGGLKSTQLSFTVYARDKYGNVAKVPNILSNLVVSVSPSINTPITTSSASGGRYIVRYTPTEEGETRLSVMYNGIHISGSPYSVLISSSAENEAHHLFTTVSDGTDPIDGRPYRISTVNKVTSIPLIVRNNIGEPSSNGGQRYTASLQGVPCGECVTQPVVTQSSIDYSCCVENTVDPPTIKYLAVKAGLASLDVAMVLGKMAQNPKILSSPFELQIVPAVTHPQSSTLQAIQNTRRLGSETIENIAGIENNCVIVARDVYGNQQIFKEGEMSYINITFSGPSQVSATLTDGSDGTFSMFYKITSTGVYSLAVKIKGTDISGSPFSVIVKPENLFVRASTSEFSIWKLADSGPFTGKYVGTAGVSNVVLVTSRDAFGNVYTGTATVFSMSMTQEITRTSTMKAAGPGFYNLSWIQEKSGTYFGRIFGGCNSAETCTNIRGSPFIVQILPDRINAEQCQIYGAGTTYGVANENTFLFILARDQYGNDVVSEDSIVFFEMKLSSSGTKRNGFLEYSQQGDQQISLYAQGDSVSTDGIKMIYKALMPGSYEIDVKYNNTRIGGTSGTKCGTDKPCPVVGKASAPLTLKTQFSDSGGHIYIDFDQQTNKANMTGDFPCNMLFAEITVKSLAATPSDAKCRFLSDKKLDIQLGFGATILVNEDLMWKPDVLKLRPACTSPEICFDFSLAIEGLVRIQRPTNPVSPTAILKAPASVGPCDSVVLDASSSYGSAGRQLQYFFGLAPGSKNDKDVRNFLLSKVVNPYTLETIEIPKHLLMVGEEYTIVVKVFNFLDSSDTDTVTIKKVAESGPAVFIEGPNTAEVRSSQSLKLRGSAKLSACNVGAEDIDWLWSVISNVPSSKLLTLNEQTRDTRSLFVPANALVPGYSYLFTLTGRMRENSTNFGSATVKVDCIFAPLVARIKGGDQAVSMNSDFTLSASDSLDLDGDQAVGNFNYKWSCQNDAGNVCFVDVDGLLLRDAGKLELARGTLVPGVYYFGITVSKEPGPRTASTSVTLFVMPTAQMPVSVLPLPQPKVNANERLVLQGSFENGCGSSEPLLEWSQRSGDDVLLYPLTISTPVNIRGLAFKPNVLVPGATYRFRLTTRCPTSSVGPISAPMGFGEIAVKMNVAPSSGQLMVTPTIGTAKDTFTLKMVNWVDDPEDLPFKYEFRYATQRSPNDQIPLGSVDVNVIQAKLPGPSPKDSRENPEFSHKIVVLAFVVDQYAASTKAEFVVTVKRTRTAGPSEFSGALLDQHVSTGNVEGIIQMTISLSNEDGMPCSAKESMVSKLKDAASKVVMNKAEVAGFAYAVKCAMDGDCVAGSGGRRLLSDSATSNALELTGSLVSNSMKAGLDSTAERGMADTLSKSLGGISAKNTARRSLRRLLSMNMYMQHGVPETPPFFRGREGRDFHLMRTVPEDQYHLLSADSAGMGPSQKSADMLMNSRDALMASQLNGAVTGEDAKGVNTEKIAMKALQANPKDLAGAKLGTGSSSFGIPPGMFQPTKKDENNQAKSSNLADSPYDSDNAVGNVAGLSFDKKVENLTDPIVLTMPTEASKKLRRSLPARGSPIQYKCVGNNGKVSAQTYWTLTDCVAGCANMSKGTCIEMANDACQKDVWDSCVYGEVDTCRFWNAKLNDWDGEGCIVHGSAASGGVTCHCYHLTDFGGAGNDVMPKMNVPDPTNPGAAFKNLGADKILVIAVLCLFLLTYWGLLYWGWRQDRIDNERLEAMDGKEALSKAQERKMRNAEQNEAMVQGNNFRLLQKAMNGKLSKSMMMIRNKAVKLFKSQHKLFSGFFTKRHHYTRPRRFTVLFVMLMGNMMINGFFCGNEKSSMVAKIIMGIIASMIMVPATMFFKWIFMTLDVDPRTRARWEREISEDNQRRKQEMAMTMTVGPTADGISAPPPHLRGIVPPRKIVRGYVPNPDQARMGAVSRINTFATKFKRRWTHTANQAPVAAEREDTKNVGMGRAFTPVSLGSVGRQSSTNSLSSRSGSFERQQEVGAYLPRRALPMRSSPRPPAPSVLSSRDEYSSLTSSVTPVPVHLTREMEDGPAERKEALQKHELHSKKERQPLSGRAKFEAAIAKKMVASISKPVDERAEKRQKLIDHRFQYMAYFMATMFYGICFYFCLLLGVTFSSEIERAWLTAFFLAIFQDLFINEPMVISISTTVKMVLIPNIAALISGRIAKKYL